ncbi:hypothetical protein KK101_11065 [Curtobacterium flaccumfaciens pv. oortii]|uniref:hypothetical protein n=1 Tax=Curtobacterium flaccumfaciens TaxID=2035 RepID=UPI001BDF4C92|nr:hypothetical protein [Curtobacterium flaccumfaciens]MBT1623226.1 hypothetical protein [Curtobacterium flaccumfaciens pv. oortii]
MSVMAAAVLLLSGCTPAVETTKSPDAHLEMAGPWAEEFRAALDDGVSDFEFKVLADGDVTTAELEAAHERVGRCLADSGLRIDYDPDGGFGLESLDGRYPDGFFERSDPILRKCEETADEYVTYLYEETRRNPDRLDDAKITVPCLRKAGLVGPDYTEEQWRKDQDADAFPFDSMGEQAKQCALDPLGLWRQ